MTFIVALFVGKGYHHILALLKVVSYREIPPKLPSGMVALSWILCGQSRGHASMQAMNFDCCSPVFVLSAVLECWSSRCDIHGGWPSPARKRTCVSTRPPSGFLRAWSMRPRWVVILVDCRHSGEIVVAMGEGGTRGGVLDPTLVNGPT
jgi:hypothetical protein